MGHPLLALDLPHVVATSLRPAIVNSLVNNIITTGYFTYGIVSVNALYPLLSKDATTTWEGWNTLP